MSDCFYPDLISEGGLCNALQNALTATGSGLKVSGLEATVKFVVYARVEFGSRFSQVYIASNERLFLFDFWNRGVMLAQGKTPGLVETAKAINR